jgi:hypothetical protein
MQYSTSCSAEVGSAAFLVELYTFIENVWLGDRSRRQQAYTLFPPDIANFMPVQTLIDHHNKHLQFAVRHLKKQQCSGRCSASLHSRRVVLQHNWRPVKVRRGRAQTNEIQSMFHECTSEYFITVYQCL